MYCCVLKKGKWLVFDVLRSDLLSNFLYLMKTSYITFDNAKVGRNSVAEKKMHAFLFVLLRHAAILCDKSGKGLQNLSQRHKNSSPHDSPEYKIINMESRSHR